jgi:hypothetical protein
MDRPHTLLAIGWGPLIQIVILIDHEDREHPYLLDGFFIIRNIKTDQVSVPTSSMMQNFKKGLMDKLTTEE